MDSTVSATLDAMTSALPRLSALQDPIRVVIADDHGGFVRAITTTLERAGIWVVAIAATGQGALDAIRTERPAIALVDMRMPGLSGIDVATSARRLAPATRVVILSAYVESEIIASAISAGAFGYVSKDSSPSTIVAAISSCAEGVPSLPSTLPEKLRRSLAEQALQASPSVPGCASPAR